MAHVAKFATILHMLKKIGFFVATVLGAGGGLACILQWLEIKPKDVWGAHMSVGLPHWLWLIAALILFAGSTGLSLYSVFHGRDAAKAVTDAPGKISKLVIHSAHYVPIDGEGKTYNVTEFMRQIIAGDSLVLDIENHNFVSGDKNFVPYDPKVGVPKILRITYSYDEGPPLSIVRQEHSRLVLPEDSEIKKKLSETIDKCLAAAAFAEELSLKKNAAESELSGAKQRVAAMEKVFSPLQIEAVRLSGDLLDFLRRIGTPPSPKYTAEDIDKMSSAQMRTLIDANDGDFLEACEYYRPGGIAFTKQQLENQQTAHWTRLWPWYQKLEATYALEGFKDKVEKIRNRFLMEGITDNAFLMPIEGKYGVERIRNIAAKLWELAYKMSEKGRIT